MSNEDNGDVVRRLDTVIAILKLAHKDEIDRARATIREDEVNEAILDGASDWVSAGKLKTAAARMTKQSETTVKRRIAELVDDGVLEKAGAGPVTEYRATGVV